MRDAADSRGGSCGRIQTAHHETAKGSDLVLVSEPHWAGRVLSCVVHWFVLLFI
jgi:hypothetical protein